MIEELISHWPEAVLVTGPTAWLAYVTQLPYHRRRELHRKARYHVVRITVVVIERTAHHIRAIAWQATYILPGRARQPLLSRLRWRRRPRP